MTSMGLRRRQRGLLSAILVAAVHRILLLDGSIAFSLYGALPRLLRPTTTTTTAISYRRSRTHSFFSFRLDAAAGAFGASDDNNRGQAREAVRSLCDYHMGEWKGRAFSFAVTPDVAAGVVQRKHSTIDYKVGVSFGSTNPSSTSSAATAGVTETSVGEEKSQFSLVETYSWDDKVSIRSLPLEECQFDVDEVDASYSLDDRLEVRQNVLPSILSGMDTMPLEGLVVEHCIAAGEDRRMRCFAVYGRDGIEENDEPNESSLRRVLVSSEERVRRRDSDTPSQVGTSSSFGTMPQQGLSASDLLEMQLDADRLVDKIASRIQGDSSSSVSSSSSSSSSSPVDDQSDPSWMERLTGSVSANQEGTATLVPHDISLLEVSSGVWLGDAIIRDFSDVQILATQPGQGSKAPRESIKSSFASWEVGVQKLAVRWMWNFGDEMRQIIDVGKALGRPLSRRLTSSLAGGVYVDERLSRRVPKAERIVYMGYPAVDMVGFLVGPFAIKVPRYVHSSNPKPFFTEFAVFQQSNDAALSEKGKDEASTRLPELFCSNSQRLYNYQGALKQGVTSFYSFQRFGAEGTMMILLVTTSTLLCLMMASRFCSTKIQRIKPDYVFIKF